MTTLGIDIGGSSVKAAAFDGRELLATAKSRTYRSPDADTVRSAVADAVGVLGVEPSIPATIGVCLPGIVEAGVVQRAVNLPALEGHTVASLTPFEQPRCFGDALAAGYGYWAHQAEPPRHPGRLATLVLGTGVGFTVLDNGVPVLVDAGSSGHLGQVDVSLSRDAPLGPDGGRGTLEAFVGADALRQTNPDEPHRTLLEPGAARNALVRALRIVLALYRPAGVALLGGIGSRLGPAIGAIRHEASHELSDIVDPAWHLTAGGDDHSAAIGSALLAANIRAESP